MNNGRLLEPTRASYGCPVDANTTRGVAFSMKRLALFCLVLLTVGAAPRPARADTDLAGANAVIETDVVRLDVANDLSYKVTEHDRIKLLTDDGRQRFSQVTRLYDADEA